MFDQYVSRRNIVSVLLFLAITGGAVFAALSLNHRRVESAASQGQIPPVAMVHVPGGFPIALSNFSIGNDDDGNGRQPYLKGLSFRVVALRGVKLTALNFAVFEFNAKGALKRVSGFVSEQDDISQRPADISFPLARRFQSGDRLVLAVEGVSNDTARWEVNFNDLARQAANLVKGRPAEILVINENKEATPDSGAVLCLKNMRRANEFAQPASDSEPPAKITSLSCDQNQRTFSFAILGKNL